MVIAKQKFSWGEEDMVIAKIKNSKGNNKITIEKFLKMIYNKNKKEKRFYFMKVGFDCEFICVEPLGVREVYASPESDKDAFCNLCDEELVLSYENSKFSYRESYLGILKIVDVPFDYVYICPFCYYLNDYINKLTVWGKTGFHKYKFFLPRFSSLMLASSLATEENNYKTLNNTNILKDTRQTLWKEFLDIKSLEGKQNPELIKRILEQRFDVYSHKVVKLLEKPLTFSEYCKMFFESLFYQTIEEKEEVNKDNKKNSNQEEGENVNKSEFGNFKLISEI